MAPTSARIVNLLPARLIIKSGNAVIFTTPAAPVPVESLTATEEGGGIRMGDDVVPVVKRWVPAVKNLPQRTYGTLYVVPESAARAMNAARPDLIYPIIEDMVADGDSLAFVVRSFGSYA